MVIRAHGTANSREVAEIKMEGKRPRGRDRLWWKGVVRRDMKVWKVREEWAIDRDNNIGNAMQDPIPRTVRRRRKVRKVRKSIQSNTYT